VIDDSGLLAALFMDVVPKAMRELRKEVRNRQSLNAMTIPQFRILALLSEDPANNCELADQLGISVAAVSRMVDWLSERSYVERLQDSGDRRKVKIQLTRKGREHFGRFRKEARARLQKRLASMGTQDRKNLNQGLAALSKAVEHMAIGN